LFASIIRVFVMSNGNVDDSAMQAAVALRQYVVPKDRPDLSGPPMLLWISKSMILTTDLPDADD
jgi:hypothetical protein